MNFVNGLKKELDETTQLTENGGIGFSTSGSELLNMNFKLSSYRNCDEIKIVDDFVKAFYENKMLAMKFLFFVRDREQGAGERRTFRACINYLAKSNPELVKPVISLIPFFGRYDDLLGLLDTDVKKDVIDFIDIQLKSDIDNMIANKPISLAAKWLPSINASSKETKRYGRLICKELNITEPKYRKMLSKLRAYLDVVETHMSAKEWGKVNYSTVPSRANLIYNGAFLRNDEDRRREYLEKLSSGDKSVKINAGVLFPSDIVHKYSNSSSWYSSLKPFDTTIEELWKALPDFVNGNGNTICIADGSGSMTNRIGNTSVTALEVANALAIYFAEHSSGEFKNKYITFSSRPQLVDFSNAKTLRDKLQIALRHNEMTNTNIEATFALILKTAVANHMSQEDMPDNVLILSDMEFDYATRGYGVKMDKTVFRTIQDKFTAAGYKVPRCIFWNIMSRTGTFPVNKHETFPVALVSGFSPAIMKMVLSNELDPYKCLLDQINSDRYKSVGEALKDIIK